VCKYYKKAPFAKRDDVLYGGVHLEYLTKASVREICDLEKEKSSGE